MSYVYSERDEVPDGKGGKVGVWQKWRYRHATQRVTSAAEPRLLEES